MKNEKTPESARDKKERKRFSPKKLLAITLAAGSVALPLAGCSDKNVGASPGPTATKTELASPSASATELTIDEQLARQEKFESYAPAMEQCASMDVDTFERLPMDERLPYAQYVLDSMVIYDGYKATYGESTELHKYMIEPVVVSTDNTGQEIIDSHFYDIQRSYLLCGENDDGTDGTAEGNKALSSAYYRVGKNKTITNEYYNNKIHQRERDESVGVIGKEVALKTSKLLTGTDDNGEKVKYKLVTYTAWDGETEYSRFAYHEYRNYDGSEKAVWLLDAQSGESIDDLDHLGVIR